MAFQCYECHHKAKRCHYHENFPSFYKVGETKDWPGEKVWLPSSRGPVSLGPCEHCSKVRPCVDC